MDIEKDKMTKNIFMNLFIIHHYLNNHFIYMIVFNRMPLKSCEQ